MNTTSLALAVAMVMGCSSPIHSGIATEGQQEHDEWENPNSFPAAIETCDEIPTSLLHEVTRPEREQSIASLTDVSTIQLTEEEAARLIDVPRLGDTSLASSLVAAELDALRARKHRAVVERRDRWSRVDEAVLASLSESFAAEVYETYRPYLVRAVAKNEGTGRFYASMCEDALYVHHGSLGRSIPPSTRVPIVVFLNQPPIEVFVTWSMAE